MTAQVSNLSSSSRRAYGRSHVGNRRVGLQLASATAAALLLSAALGAQTTKPLPAAPSAVLAQQHQETAVRPAGSNFTWKAPTTFVGPGGIPVEQLQDGALAISLDDAIALGLERNVRLRYDRANEQSVKGESLGILNALLPSITLDAESSAQEINLAAMGFKPSLLAGFASSGLLPAGYTIPTIVKVNTTQANARLSQVLFNLTDYELYRAVPNEVAVVKLTTLNDRGDVINAVASLYLGILADQASLTNAQAQERTAKAVLDQANDRHNAGVGVKLDVLRAQVDYQQREQTTIAAQNKLDKDSVQLTRVLGLPAGQRLELTDTTPYADLAAMDLDHARATAYEHRKDLLSLEQQVALTSRELKAVKFQRLPVLAFNGAYGVIGVTDGSYHGDFSAVGSLSVPIFKEAEQRGQEQTVGAQLMALRQRDADLRETVDAQIRTAMLDVDTSHELVKVAQSNVELARQILSDARDRFSAGVDDNLAVVDAESGVANAQAQLLDSLYQYNTAKLQLARATGIIESHYRDYLGK